MRKNLTKHFFKYIKKTPTCWLFTGAKTHDGYGAFYDGKRQTVASRFHWTVRKGLIPKGMLVCHKCDVRNCVKISHLFLGTQKDNSSDMLAKARDCWGEKHYCHKLTAEDVAEIRHLYIHYQGGVLARIYGVSPATIAGIVKRRGWKHI